jgi:anthranilate synthase component 1
MEMDGALRHLPFAGGAIGFLPYHEHSAALAGRVMQTDRLIVQEQGAGRGLFIASSSAADAPSVIDLQREFKALVKACPGSGQRQGTIHLGESWHQRCDQNAYVKAVKAAKREIARGDVQQVILSLSLSRAFSGPSYALYQSLRNINTAPQNFYLRFPSFALLGTPPSPYLTIAGGRVTMDIGAGTRAVTGDQLLDDRVAAELASDFKETREHQLLVDEARATLAQIAKPGSVTIREPMTVRRFSHVMHLFTALGADVDDSVAPSEVLAAALPPSPVTGVPTRPAARTIAALEREPRGPYGGVYILVGFEKNLHSTIVERSMWVESGEVHIRVGAGITAESDPESEYAECLRKAKALMSAVEQAGASDDR